MVKTDKKITIIYILLLLSIIFGLYFISNYKQFKIYIFEGTNRYMYVSGNATFSKKVNLLNINQIIYKGPDIQAQELSISITFQDEGKEVVIFKTVQKIGDKETVEEKLKNFYYTQKELYGYEEIFTNKVKKDLYTKVFVNITIKDYNNQNHTYSTKIKGQIYSNNGFIYIPSPHF